MKEKAIDYYLNKGYSCAESIIAACSDEGLCGKELLPCSTAFSAGMGSGCLCGAVAASQMVIGYNFGRENSKSNELQARAKAKELIEKFKEKNRVTCCRVLNGGFEGAARKQHCQKMVGDAAEILEELIKVKV